jgi:hypothetical protein
MLLKQCAFALLSSLFESEVARRKKMLIDG